MEEETRLRKMTPREQDLVRQEYMLNRLSLIVKDTGSHVMQRYVGIIEACATDELSTDDLAEKFDVHYQTMHGNIRNLVELGFLEPTQKFRGRTKYYRTAWDMIPENMQGVELRWRSGAGEFNPISTYIHRFLNVGPRRLSYELEMFGRLLVSNRINKKLEYLGEPNYGDSHNDAVFLRMQSCVDFLENIVFVMRQAIESPIMTEPEGWQMYKLPSNLSAEDANQIHDELEMYFQQEGYYEET